MASLRFIFSFRKIRATHGWRLPGQAMHFINEIFFFVWASSFEEDAIYRSEEELTRLSERKFSSGSTGVEEVDKRGKKNRAETHSESTTEDYHDDNLRLNVRRKRPRPPRSVGRHQSSWWGKQLGRKASGLGGRNDPTGRLFPPQRTGPSLVSGIFFFYYYYYFSRFLSLSQQTLGSGGPRRITKTEKPSNIRMKSGCKALYDGSRWK